MDPFNERIASAYPPFLTVAQVQEVTQLGRGQVYRLVQEYLESDGATGIPSVRFGRCLRVPRDELLRIAALDALAKVTE